jgi:archaellum biogenesis ATPase FlaH
LEKTKDDEILASLRITDPRSDKKRIENTQGGLLKDLYRWVLENPSYKQWHEDPGSELLWIKGDPGKGKTMLLCGIIEELEKSMSKTTILSYFFCQATDSRINNATAVMRGLLYMLVSQQPALVSYIRETYDQECKTMFKDVNAWVELEKILTDVLRYPGSNTTYLIIDALDECVTDLPKLLEFVVKHSSTSSRVKWIVSSRNWLNIEESLKRAGHKVQLCLELNAESVSTAVSKFIQYKVSQLAERKGYNDVTRDAVLRYLSLNANDTFLWVALVCQTFMEIHRWDILARLNEFPAGLNPLYKRMMKQISDSRNATRFKPILASIATVYRPITLEELTSLSEQLDDVANDLEAVKQIVSLCGSFLTVRENTIYFVHQSAKDFLLNTARNEIFPSTIEEVHYTVFSRSLQVMSKTFRRDMHSLGTLGYPAKKVQRPDVDPLAASYYSCIY